MKDLKRSVILVVFGLCMWHHVRNSLADAGIESEDAEPKGKNKGQGLTPQFDLNAMHSHSAEVLLNPPPPKPKPSYLYSSGSIRKLARDEKEIYSAISDYVGSVERRIILMKRYMRDYEESSVNAQSHLNQTEKDYMVVANPLIAHRLIRRFAIDYPEIIKAIDEKSTQISAQALDKLKRKDEEMPFPDFKEDYFGSVDALMRIQTYSNLNPFDMAEGKLGGLEGSIGYLDTGIGLSGRDAFDLADFSDSEVVSTDFPDVSGVVEWYEVALDNCKKEPEFQEQCEIFVGKKLRNAAENHDRICADPEISIAKQFCFSELVGDNFGPRGPKQRRTKLFLDKLSNDYRNEPNSSMHIWRNWVMACSGISLQDPEEAARLRCWYEHKKHPYLTISPAKFELLNESPELLQIHDIIGPKAIASIIKEASPKLKRSQVVYEPNTTSNGTADGKNSQVSSSRTSLTFAYDETEYAGSPHGQLLDSMARHIEYVTGLNVHNVRVKNASESLQVATYRTSHHFDEHLDPFEDELGNGDRLATFMSYLSDVDVGGLTGFPAMGTAAKPIKGSAIFWYNLHRNGTTDKRTWHGGCPVIHGVKWVSTKWIRFYENFDKRPCSLNPEE